MNIERLCDIAVKATRHTLRYHVGADMFDDDVQALIREGIHELYPLRDMAQDTSVADLEIACDAAITVAEAYNKAVPETPSINLRWFYHCVQSLLLLDLIPQALLDGKVDRLPRNVQQRPSCSASENESFTVASSSTLGPETPTSSSEQSAASSNNTKGASAKAAKAKWEPAEIQLMVELKASGLCHRDIATRLGRGQGSVENKYGRVMQTDEWRDYSNTCEANVQRKKKTAEDDECRVSLP